MKKTLIALALTAGATLSVMAQDVVDTAVKAGNFTTLVTAVKAAGLVETLKGPGPFTVFAPTDAAFAKVPKATLDALLADKAALTKAFLAHFASADTQKSLEEIGYAPLPSSVETKVQDAIKALS